MKRTRQHYVPKLYLRNFTHINKKECLYSFDKIKVDSYPSNIKNICQEKEFYDELESKFAVIESRCSNTFKSLINEKNHLFLENPANRGLISIFMAIQYLRTKEIRETLHNQLLEIKSHLDKDPRPLNPKLEKEFTEQEKEEATKSCHLKLVEMYPELANILAKKKWILLINSTKIPFWTSDHPLVRFNPFFNPNGNLGLKSTGIKIYFPLNPKLSLCLLDPEVYQYYNQLKFTKTSFKTQDIMKAEKRIITDVSDILFQNSLQVTQSTRHIFSNVNNFDLAEEMIKEDPKLKNIDKKRFEVKDVTDTIFCVKNI